MTALLRGTWRQHLSTTGCYQPLGTTERYLGTTSRYYRALPRYYRLPAAASMSLCVACQCSYKAEAHGGWRQAIDDGG